MFSLMILISFIPRVQQRHAVFFRNLRVAAFSNEKYAIAFLPKMPGKNGIIRSRGWTSAPYKTLLNSAKLEAGLILCLSPPRLYNASKEI